MLYDNYNCVSYKTINRNNNLNIFISYNFSILKTKNENLAN